MTARIKKETDFLNNLELLQKIHNAYWIQTRHIATMLFGKPKNNKMFRRNKMRVHRIANRVMCDNQNVVCKTRWEKGIGKSTGVIQVKYYHLFV